MVSQKNLEISSEKNHFWVNSHSVTKLDDLSIRVQEHSINKFDDILCSANVHLCL